MYNYYKGVLANWFQQTPNTEVRLEGQQLIISGQDPTADRYFIYVDAAVMSQVTYYGVDNVNLDAQFIFLVGGDGDVQLKGAPFKADQRNTVYAVNGTRTLTVTTRLRGSILAPDVTLNGGGTMDAWVIVGLAEFIEIV